MGKPRMDLLKGIAEQENAIENSKAYQEEEPQKKDAVRFNLTKAEEPPIQEPRTFTLIREEPKKQEPITYKLVKAAPEEKTPEEEKNKEKANTKPQKAVMGFRADQRKIEVWKLYADASGQEIGIMCTAAIDEYINNHELTADQKQIFDIKMNALEAERRIKGL